MAGTAKITVAITGTTLKGAVNISRSMTFDSGSLFEQSVRNVSSLAGVSDFTPRFMLVKNIGAQTASIRTRSGSDLISDVEPGDIAVLCGIHSDIKASGNGLLETIGVDATVSDEPLGVVGEGGESVTGEGGETILPEG